jgi:thymidylate kinase
MIQEQLPADYQTVVIDGCDGTGKTTLAGRLAAQGFTVVHCGPTPRGVDFADRYRNVLTQNGRLALDRCFLSELVYGPLFRGRSRISWATVLELATAVAARRGVFVHLTGSTDAVRSRLLARDAAAPPAATIEAVLHAYRGVFARLAEHTPVIHLDINTTTPTCGLLPAGAADDPSPVGDG